MFDWLRRSNAWKPPKVSENESTIKKYSPADLPVSKHVIWEGSELVVSATELGSVSLFDLILPDLEHCRIAFGCSIHVDSIQGGVYPEMWCRIPERGLFFSRGVDQKVSKPTGWIDLEIPFYLEKGQIANLLHLNLAFEGAGRVRLKNIQVRSAELET